MQGFAFLQGGLLALLSLTHLMAAVHLQFVLARGTRPWVRGMHVAMAMPVLWLAAQVFELIPALWWASLPDDVLPRLVDLAFGLGAMVMGWLVDLALRLKKPAV